MIDSPSVRASSKCWAMSAWPWSARNRRSARSTSCEGTRTASVQSARLANPSSTRDCAKAVRLDAPNPIFSPAWLGCNFGILISPEARARYPGRAREGLRVPAPKALARGPGLRLVRPDIRATSASIPREGWRSLFLRTRGFPEAIAVFRSCPPQSALCANGALKVVAQAVTNRFRSADGRCGQLRKLIRVERPHFFDGELWIWIPQASPVVDKFPL